MRGLSLTFKVAENRGSPCHRHTETGKPVCDPEYNHKVGLEKFDSRSQYPWKAPQLTQAQEG